MFLDLKLYDIPETVKRAVAHVSKTGVRFLTVHGSNAIMRAAVEGRGSSTLGLLAVTVLTSFDQQDLADLGYPSKVADLVALRVKNAMASGIDGIVCSPLEAAAVRELAGPKAILVTPGVRSRKRGCRGSEAGGDAGRSDGCRGELSGDWPTDYEGRGSGRGASGLLKNCDRNVAGFAATLPCGRGSERGSGF